MVRETEEDFPTKENLELSSEGWVANLGEKWVEGLSSFQGIACTKSQWWGAGTTESKVQGKKTLGW